MNNISKPKDVFVMCSDPSPDLTIEKAHRMFEEIKNEKDIAFLFSAVENKACWIADEVYDFEKGTKAYKKATERTDAWVALSDKLKNRIFDILKSEGVKIPNRGQIVALESFMKRNGFINGNGWWIEE